MRTVLLSFFWLFSFFATPMQLIQDLLRMTAVDSPRIEISGVREGETAAPVTIVYDSVTDEILFSVGDERLVFRGEKIPSWMRLFFHKKSADKPTDQAASFLSYLASLGIATDKKGISIVAPEGDVVVFIGREKTSESSPALFLYHQNHLPYRLVTRDFDVRFEEYHRSILPLVLPGKITIVDQDKIVVYRFMRNEYR